MDQGPFFGCVRFPLCKSTLPITVNQMPTAVVQEAMKRETRSIKRGSTSLGSSADSFELLTDSLPEDSQSPQMINANLTPDELKALRQLRKNRNQDLKEGQKS